MECWDDEDAAVADVGTFGVLEHSVIRIDETVLLKTDPTVNRESRSAARMLLVIEFLIESQVNHESPRKPSCFIFANITRSMGHVLR